MITSPPIIPFPPLSLVEKIRGDYTFEGTVVSVFTNLSGSLRYVVEDDRGVLHIYSAKDLKMKVPA